MKLDAVEQIVRATLYEGYMLYPYRPTSVKNQQRWNFGVLYPRPYSEVQRGSDACSMQTECLVLANPGATLEVRVRFLRLMQREIGKLAKPLPEMPADKETAFQLVDLLETEGQRFKTWQEAVEQEVSAPLARLIDLEQSAMRVPFSLPAIRTLEPIHGRQSSVVGVIVRKQEFVTGELEISAQQTGDLVRVKVAVLNRTPFEHCATRTRDQALLRSMVSTHTILGARGAEFVSLLDPPDQFRSAAAGCRNIGTWPVLVGEEGSNDTMLSSPIILYDFPQIAPESPGDLFDGTEIDEILTLRIMTLTEEEKREMRGADDRTRKILERTEMLPVEQLMKMHGALRGLKTVKSEG